MQLLQAWKVYYENERKFNTQNTLYLAGGVNQESIRIGKFSLESEIEQLHLAEKEIEIQRIGYRDKDLINAGVSVPEDYEDKKVEFIELATARFQAELAGAQAQYEAANKELQSAIIAKNELTIRSPASGIIVSRSAEEGERIKREDKIFTIIDAGALYVSIAVQEADAFRLSKGMKASVTIDGISTRYEGSVDMISPIADSQSFTFSVRILLSKEALINSVVLNKEGITNESDNREPARPGMFARVSIILGEAQDSLTIKENALINKNNNEGYCFIVNGNSLVLRKILLGKNIEDEYIVLSGLSTGDLTVLHPDSGLQEGDYVSITE
jgi:multidrug efflux pump subunit AcrA (membrane-fusion protein)